LNEERATVRLSLGGGPRHRLATLIAAEVALEKKYHLEDTTTWRGGRVIPDLVLSKNGRSWKDRETLWLEVIDTHDPRREWSIRGYGVRDVLALFIADMKDGPTFLGQVYDEALKVIP
jgi:hypothetical protein